MWLYATAHCREKVPVAVELSSRIALKTTPNKLNLWGVFFPFCLEYDGYMLYVNILNTTGITTY